jgi:hypothetical protein
MRFFFLLRNLRSKTNQATSFQKSSAMKMNELERKNATTAAFPNEKSSVEIDANNNSKLKRGTNKDHSFNSQLFVQISIFSELFEELSLREENESQILKAKKQTEQFLSCKSVTNNVFSIENHLDEEMLEASRAVWNVNASEFAKHTSNPVRKLIEQMKIEPNPELPMIALSIGDPTIFSDIGKPDTVINAICNCVKEKKFDGYTPSYGTETARQAIAKYYSKPDKNVMYKSSDIYLSNGCSQAIDLCITVLASRGQNILIPKPGFSIYKTLAGTLGIDVKYYQLIVS